MNEIVHFTAIGLIIAAALVACYHLLCWIARQWTLSKAQHIARSLSKDKAQLEGARELIEKLEHYKLSRVRADLGAATALSEAAADLVDEYRISGLRRR